MKLGCDIHGFHDPEDPDPGRDVARIVRHLGELTAAAHTRYLCCAAANVRRVSSRQNSIRVDANSSHVDSSITALDIDVSFFAGAPMPAARLEITEEAQLPLSGRPIRACQTVPCRVPYSSRRLR